MPLNSVHAPRSDDGRSEAQPGDAQQSDPHPSDARLEPLVIATGNAGKLREFRDLLAGLPFAILAHGDLGIPSPEETGSTFLDNAFLKARHAAAASGAAAIADDSGLEVDALGGAPGIYSARYAGVDATDADNNAKLLAALRALGAPPWRARYRCALVFVAGPEDAAPLTADGVWEGCIVESPRGTGGFGYDPYFFLPELQLTAAELDSADKNRRSHRGMAMRALRQFLAAREQARSRS
jgi:XTP/dITP diphosphohydrolase